MFTSIARPAADIDKAVRENIDASLIHSEAR
jgi:hypothetical protein